VTKLADPRAVRVRCDGADDPRWRVVSEDAIEVDSEIGEHRFEIATRARAIEDIPDRKQRSAPASATTGVDAGGEARTYVPASAPSCGPCCATAAEKR
jgi:hypothetical protein